LRCFRLLLLIAILGFFSFVPSSSQLSTCRCCLWTTPCGALQKLPTQGFYRIHGRGGSYHAGVFVKGDRDWYTYRFENVQANRIRLGWPFATITLDVLQGGSEWHDTFGDAVQGGMEWHAVFEHWFWVNLILLFLVWLCLQPVIGFVHRRRTAILRQLGRVGPLLRG
jgi:hypothetical protein